MFELLNYIFVFLFFLSILSALFKKMHVQLFIMLIATLLVFIATTRELGFDRDSEMYLDMFNRGGEDTEISFKFITYLVKNILGLSFEYLIFLYALIAVSIKVFVIKNSTDFPFASILIYFSYFFLLQEMTQIRVGVASAFLLVMIKNLIDKKLYLAILFFIIAIMFHTSSLIFILVFFINKNNINKKIYLFIIFFSYLLYPFVDNYTAFLVKYLKFDIITRKALSYSIENGLKLNVFNFWQIIRVFLCIVFIKLSDKLKQINKHSIMFIKLYVISTCFFVILSNNPVFAGRVSDLFALTDFILIPFVFYLIPRKYYLLGNLAVLFFAFSYLYLNLYYIKIFN